MLQVFNPDCKDTHSLDVARQNYLNRERGKVFSNSEVERMAISEVRYFYIFHFLSNCYYSLQNIKNDFYQNFSNHNDMYRL